MNDIMIFNNEEFGEIRTVEIDGKPYFMATDIAKALGYSKPNNAISAHCRAALKYSTPISGKMQEVNFIPEGDVYRLIIRSQLPTAEKFEKWVFDEVLPSIRKTGGYRIPHTVGGQIQLLAQGYTELAQEVHEFKEEVNTKIDKLENDIPLYGCEMEEITQHVKRKVVTILGGKDSAAYRNKSIRNSVFADIYRQLKREYGAVSTYKSIKRKYIADAHEFIDCYAVPRVIEDEIEEANSQVKLSV